MKNLRAVPSKKPDKHSKRLKRISPGAAYLYRAVIIPKMQEKTVNTSEIWMRLKFPTSKPYTVTARKTLRLTARKTECCMNYITSFKSPRRLSRRQNFYKEEFCV